MKVTTVPTKPMVLGTNKNTQQPVAIPLDALTHHGLVVGKSGSGKSKTLQVIAEGLHEANIPVILLDVKGDLSGLAKPGKATQALFERQQEQGKYYQSAAYPVQFLSMGNEAQGRQLHFSVVELGPVLLARLLQLTEEEATVLKSQLATASNHSLHTLDDLTTFLTQGDLSQKGDEKFIPAICHKIALFKKEGGDDFFGAQGVPYGELAQAHRINVVRLKHLRKAPHVFTTCMLSLLVQLSQRVDERSDKTSPALVVLLEHSDLIFHKASEGDTQFIAHLLELLRLKKVGVLMSTRKPQSIPEAIKQSLGLKIFHQGAEMALAPGEALITLGKAEPVKTLIQAPKSRLGPLTTLELEHYVREGVSKD